MIDGRRSPRREWNEDRRDFFEILDAFRRLVAEAREGTRVLPMGVQEKMEKFLSDIDDISE